MKKKMDVKNLKRCFFAIVLGATLSVTAFTGSAALAAPEIPVDTSGIENYTGGRPPAGLDASYYTLPQNTNSIAPRTQAELPRKYDLRTKNLVTGTRAQNPWGSCWSFGNTAGIESNAVLKGAGAADTLDYSEHFMAWFAFQPYQGEGYKIVSGEENVLNFGGIRQIATADTTAWIGPVSETLAPYTNAAGTLEPTGDWSLPESLHNETNDEVHVQNVDYLPETGIYTGTDVDTEGHTYKTGYSFDETALKAVKNALMENGVLDVSYYSAKSLPGQTEETTEIFNMKTHAQYSPRNVSANHEVSIVGWDDTYSVENFSTKPSEPGAWIVKNSWGKGDGGAGSVDAEGYFYISYYDQTVSEFTSYQVDVAENGLFTYDNNYQYDFLGYKSVVPSKPGPESSGNKIANVFTAKKDEVLKAVSAITVDTNSTVNIEIYKLASGADLSTPGEALSVATAYPTYGGYHTIALDTPVELMAGDRFAVVETITGDNGGYLPIEMGYSGTLGPADGKYITIAKAEPGQSYIYAKENDQYVWTDLSAMPKIPVGNEELSFGNAMIKAFTANKDIAAAVTLTIESFDPQDQSLGNQTITNFSTAVSLPDNTAQIALTSNAQNGIVRLSIDESAYTEGTKIPADSLVTIATTTQPRDNNSSQYTISFKVTSVLSDNGVTLTGTQELLPLGTTFSAKILDEKNLNNKKALAALKNNHKVFTLYQVKTLNADKTSVILKDSETVTMSFPLPEIYKAAKTGVYLVKEDGSIAPFSTSVTTSESQMSTLATSDVQKSSTLLNINTNMLNGTYAIALEKDPAAGGSTTDSSQPLDSGKKSTSNVLTGILEAPQYTNAVCVAVLTIILSAGYFYFRRKTR